jgi:XTP/dITP diphosphohydrolase
LRRLVVATHNLKKGGEMATILGRRLPWLELLTLEDFPGSPEPDETGETYAENAAIKARSASEFTGEWAIADDAGLEVDALGGEPGLHSKRFGGEGLPFREKMAMILGRLIGVPEAKRSARFRCCVALAPAPGDLHRLPPSLPGKEEGVFVFEATCEGRIAFEPRGEGGFGYDPIFFLPELGRTMAELSPNEKHAISHRGKVLKLAGDWLEATLPRS